MEHYNFWQDFFDTYQSLSDWMKFAWLVVPPVFLLGLLALVMRYRLASKCVAAPDKWNLAYTVFSDENGILRIYTHNGADALADGKATVAQLPLPGAYARTLAKPPSSDV